MKAKSLLRKKMRKVINSATRAEVDIASEKVCFHLTQNQELLQKTSTIAIYSAYGNEVDLQALHGLLPDKVLTYPLCHPDSRLSFHNVPRPGSLISGAFGILEPSPAQHTEVSVENIDLFLCPGLAFTLSGIRLGQGKGFYDRALERKKTSAKIVGVAMARQILDDIPRENHDLDMDYILTDEGLYQVG